jgi:hypothetical protein
MVLRRGQFNRRRPGIPDLHFLVELPAVPTDDLRPEMAGKVNGKRCFSGSCWAAYYD